MRVLDVALRRLCGSSLAFLDLIKNDHFHGSFLKDPENLNLK